MRITARSVGRSLARVAGVAATLAALGACSSLTVKTDWNTTIDFTKYKTFDFKADTLPYSTFTQERLRSTIEKTLLSKGVTRSQTNPDLVLVYRVNLASTTQYTTVSTGGYGYGPAWGGYGGYGGIGVSQTTAQEIPTGALTIALVDQKINQLVWKGEADAQLGDNESNAQLVQDAITADVRPVPAEGGGDAGGEPVLADSEVVRCAADWRQVGPPRTFRGMAGNYPPPRAVCLVA